MKKHFTLCATLLLTATLSHGQGTVSGTVVTLASGMPAPAVNHRVYAVFDSTAAYHHAPIDYYTAPSGNYSGSLPLGMPMGTGFTILTQDTCNMQVSAGTRHTYSGASGSYTQNFAVCGPMIPAGRITLGSTGTGAANAMVYYIRKCYNSTLAAFELTAIDSVATNAQGKYTMNTMPASAGGCTFFLKAALKPSAANYSSYLPTYYTSSLVWSGATTVPLPNHGPKDFALTAGINPGGPGFIGGSVLLGANKSSGVGDPLSSRILILTTQTNQPVTYTYSAANGQFSFSNIAYGTYKIFGDAWGKSNPALTVTISPAQPAVSNIVFEENSSKFEGRSATAVGHVAGPLAGVVAYPNPVQDKLAVSGLDAIRGDKEVRLFNTTGAVVFSRRFAEGEQVVIPMQSFPDALYLLRLQTSAGDAAYRVVK